MKYAGWKCGTCRPDKSRSPGFMMDFEDPKRQKTRMIEKFRDIP